MIKLRTKVDNCALWGLSLLLFGARCVGAQEALHNFITSTALIISSLIYKLRSFPCAVAAKYNHSGLSFSRVVSPIAIIRSLRCNVDISEISGFHAKWWFPFHTLANYWLPFATKRVVCQFAWTFPSKWSDAGKSMRFFTMHHSATLCRYSFLLERVVTRLHF